MKISKPYFQISINFEKPQNPSCMIWKSILKNLKNLNLEVAGGDLKLENPNQPKVFGTLSRTVDCVYTWTNMIF